jgi:D-ribose pyranose/furanose isomerase RbsD
MAEWRQAYDDASDWDDPNEELEELSGELEEWVPLLGHRNWLLITDMAFPALSGEGVHTFWAESDILSVLDLVMELLGEYGHVRPRVWLDAELDFVEEDWAQGITEFRQSLTERLRDLPVYRLPHEQLIAKVNEAASSFQVVIVKTNTTLPYTSVFLELDCAYWDDEREALLRAAMGRLEA